MLCGKRVRSKKIRPIVSLLFLIVILITLSACTATRGGILIHENPDGTGFTMDFNDWTSKNKCELSLSAGDILQIEVTREAGEINLTILGSTGTQPYTGNDLKSGLFTVTVYETDAYEIRINGKDATGKVVVKIVENVS